MHIQQALPISPFLPLFAGQIHYSRIPHQYWQHRIQMCKALGLNALSIYVMWNYHEVSKGIFDYTSPDKDLSHFLQLAEKYEMAVLFRPGPYVCAQWDFGGLPARLLSLQNIQMRANNPVFLQQTRVYFQSLVQIIHKHTRTETNPKGSILMLQIQNQYGFYGTDKNYMQALRTIWKQLNVNITEYYVDWLQNIKKCHWEGANIGINDWNRQEQEDAVRAFQKKGVILGGEIYSGWMTHWTQKWGGKSTTRVIKDYKYLLSKNASFAIYVVHGGTNFGLTAGANGLNNKQNDYWGAITSYDYDAPINEQGAPTQKYHAIRSLFQSYFHDQDTKTINKQHKHGQLPDIPAQLPLITIPPITMKRKGSLFSNLPKSSLTHDHPLVFQSKQLQMFNQGIVIYQTSLHKQQDIQINIIVHDYGLVYLGEQLIRILDRTKLKQHKICINKQDIVKNGNRLRIVVEASGHINFDKNMWTDCKGITYVKGTGKAAWTMWKCQLDYQQIRKWTYTQNKQKQVENHDNYTEIYQGQFQLLQRGDTYLDVTKYGKGYIWVNGHNLGRYWQVGPQHRLFCPGVWLNKGVNTVLVLNVYGTAGSDIQGVKELYDTPIQYDQSKQ